jgi:MoaA/NifB/PqqE/SkfB family radical SAM enzyme
MGSPKPWPTTWPEPGRVFPDEDLPHEPMEHPDYDIDTPSEQPWRLPEEQLRPYSVTWGVTHPCNLRCTHCYDVVDHTRRDLSTDQALEVIDRLHQIGISFVVFSGGEPLLRKDLFTLMADCRHRGIQIGMRSNGTLIEEATALRLASLDLAVCGISLDGASPETHDAVRGAGSFERTRRGITHLLDAGIRVNVEIVLSQRNIHESLQFIALAESLGVDEVNFSAIAPQGRGVNRPDDLLDPPTWQRVTTDLYHASQTASISVSPSCALTGACWACIEPNITCEGWVTPCYLSKHRLFHILETPVEEMITRLRLNRPRTIDICGRRQWIGTPDHHQPELA